MSELNFQESMKQADTQLRQSERQMFNGKKDEALNLFIEARTHFENAKKSDPANAQLKTFEPKLTKLMKDLERRIGRPIDGEPQTATAAATTISETPAPASKPEPAKTQSSTQSSTPPKQETPKEPAKVNIPYNARKPLQDAINRVNSMEGNLTRLEGEELDESMTKSLLSRTTNSLEDAKRLLKESIDEATKGGVPSHPDFEKVSADLATFEPRIEQARLKFEEQASQSASKAQEVNDDCELLRSENSRLRPLMDKFGLIYFNDLEPLKVQIQALEEFENNELSGLQEKIRAYENKYGTTRDEIRAKTDEAGYSGITSAVEGWDWLTEGIQKAKDTRVQVADDIVIRMDTQLTNLKNIHDFSRLTQHATLREWLKMAQRYNSESSKVKEMAECLEPKLKEDAEALSAKIDQRTWPGNGSDEVAEAALRYFNESPDWGKGTKQYKILGVAIHGNWSIQEKDILGNPIMYGIPAFAAMMRPEDEEANLARVFDVTMRTGEGPGIKQEPPFFSLTVGSSYFIRPDKIK